MSTDVSNRFGNIPKPAGFAKLVISKKVENQKLNDNNNINSDKSNLIEKKYNNDPNSLEYSRFSKLKIHEKPDSNRTLNPDLAPIQKFNRVSSCNINRDKSNGSFRSLIAKTSGEETVGNCRKVHSKVSTTFYFDDFNNAPVDPIRREFRESEFSKYKRTTQILNLPGGLKRKEIEVKDDEKSSANRTLSQSGCAKLLRDFKSAVSCLPGSYKNEEEQARKRLTFKQSYESNDIFNKKKIRNFSRINSAQKSTNNISKVKNYSPKVQKMFEQSRSRRPENIRNIHQSQIEFSDKI